MQSCKGNDIACWVGMWDKVGAGFECKWLHHMESPLMTNVCVVELYQLLYDGVIQFSKI